MNSPTDWFILGQQIAHGTLAQANRAMGDFAARQALHSIPLSIASQFVRLNGRLGWLTLPQNPDLDGCELRTSLETLILPYYAKHQAEPTTTEDLQDFARAKAYLARDLRRWYAEPGYKGD